MGFISDWVNRQRHNRGYGIQSPSEFFFVTQVLKEHLPYYAYPLLEDVAKENKLKAKHLKEIFRITNHYNPSYCIIVGSPAIACAMSIAKPSINSYCISSDETETKTSMLLADCGCNIMQGDITGLLKKTIENERYTGMLYIGCCPEQKELVDIAMSYTNNNSIIVIEGIRSDKVTKDWWQNIINNPKTIVTYDLYNYGFLLFNKERRKQHYTLKR